MDSTFAPYRGARAVVLGATGFIGRWVARRLHDLGADLHLLVRAEAAAIRLGARMGFSAHTVGCDFNDLGLLAKRLRSLEPDIVFNLAGYGVSHTERDATLAERVNTALVATICEAVAGQPRSSWGGQTIVHAGSALEYGEVGGDLHEGTPPNPTTLYGRTKLAGTQTLTSKCEQLGLPGLTARLFTVYGPGERSERLLPLLIRAAAGGGALPLTAGTQRRDFMYVEEVAEGLLRLGLATAHPGEVVNLASGRLHSVREFVETAAAILGLAPERLHFGELPTRAEEMQHAPVSNQRLRTLTGWTPRIDIQEGIRLTLERNAALTDPPLG